jgi:hypothetical protein
MDQSSNCHAEGEPPSSPVSDDASGVLADRVMAIATCRKPRTSPSSDTTPSPSSWRYCGAAAKVRSLRPGSPAPDCEPLDLAWIVDLQDEHELDEALRAARWRTSKRGRVVVEGAACSWRRPPGGPSPRNPARRLNQSLPDRARTRAVRKSMSP